MRRLTRYNLERIYFLNFKQRDETFDMNKSTSHLSRQKNYLPGYLYLKRQSSKDCFVSSADISVHSWIMKDHGPILSQLLSLKTHHVSLELFAAFLTAYVGTCTGLHTQAESFLSPELSPP